MINKILIFIGAALVLNACGGGGASISVNPTTDAYDETNPVNAQMDILWVVDPSRSMRQNVKSVNDNIESFVSDFVTKGYQFRMGVITTAAWARLAREADSNLPDELETFLGDLHQGECIGNNSGAPMLHDGSAAPGDIFAFTDLFRKNFDVYGMALNTSGCGLNHLTGYDPVPGNIFDGLSSTERSEIAQYVNDERPLQSMRAFLEAHGSTFLRPDAFLAVIIISDEIDASRNNLEPTTNYNPADPDNYSVNDFVTYLSGLKGGDDSKYAVYSIVNEDLEHSDSNISKLIADATGGLSFDIKASPAVYSNNLDQIKGNILSSASVYAFQRKPVVSSITVEIIKTTGGQIVEVPKANPPGADGWTYDPNYGSLGFGGLYFAGSAYIPSEGDEVIVRFTPADLSNGQIKAAYINIDDNKVLEEKPVGEVVGQVGLYNQTLAPTDEVLYEITTLPSSFDIDPTTGVVTTNVVLDAETKVSEQVGFRLTITHKDELGNPVGAPTVLPERTITIVTLDIPDSIPMANVAVIEQSESDSEGTHVVISGVLSRYVSQMDASELHTFEVDDSGLTATGEEFLFTGTNNGSFTYTIPKASLDFVGGAFSRVIPYTVKGTEHTDPLELNESSNTLTITITEANNAPIYSLTVCPGGNYEYCDRVPPVTGEHVVRPNTEGVTFGEVPLVAADITVSGTASGNKDDLITGNANFHSAANANGYHEVMITFPDDKMFEIGCVRIYRDESASVGNAIFQVLAKSGSPASLKPVTREVFPVGIGSAQSNRPKPSGAQGACNSTGSGYFTVYTDGKFIGNGLKILRPSGGKNSQGHENLRLDRIVVYGIEAKWNEIPLDDHFSDPDGDTLNYQLTDAFGEGPGPGWASIDPITKTLRLLPSASVNETIGVIALDSTGPGAKEAFAAIKVVGSGGESVANSAPISLLALDDWKRGGLSMRRWGGDNEIVPGDCTIPSPSSLHNNRIDHIEMDNFMFKPFDKDQVGGYYNILTDTAQAAHNGDTYGSEPEGGWCNTPVFEDPKYPLKAIADSYCTNTNFNANTGKIIPCVNGSRKYGEVYSGYFVPASTGIYKFRTNNIDNTVTLSLAPTEYSEDTQNIFTAVNNDAQLFAVLNSLVPGFTDSASAGNEFENCGSCRSVPYATNIFYDLSGIGTEYSPGYAYLKQGNVYAFEMRFGEGGSAVAFDFYYNYKPLGAAPWEGWLPMDASVVVPDRGSNAYQPFSIPVSGGGEVDFPAASLFYDAEMDVLEYTARLVNVDGSAYGDGTIGQIGLSLNLLGGGLTGTLTSYSGDPRIVIKAKERRSSGAETESLPMKFDN